MAAVVEHPRLRTEKRAPILVASHLGRDTMRAFCKEIKFLDALRRTHGRLVKEYTTTHFSLWEFLNRGSTPLRPRIQPAPSYFPDTRLGDNPLLTMSRWVGKSRPVNRSTTVRIWSRVLDLPYSITLA